MLYMARCVWCIGMCHVYLCATYDTCVCLHIHKESEGEREMKNKVKGGTECPLLQKQNISEAYPPLHASPTLKNYYLICPLLLYSLLEPLGSIDTVQTPG